MKSDLLAAVVGVGSVGRRHVESLLDSGANVITYDEAKDHIVNSSLNGAIPASTLEDFAALAQNFEPSMRALLVISTWADSHLELIRLAAELGFQNVLVEKPLTNSIHAGYEVVREVSSAGMHIYSGYARRLHTYRLKVIESIGDPLFIQVAGGAGCLITNGAHWVDLARSLFREVPTSLYSRALPKKISPRAPHLEHWEGESIFYFTEGRSLVMNFHNSLNFSPEVRLVGTAGVLDIRGSGEFRAGVYRKSSMAAKLMPLEWGSAEKSEPLAAYTSAVWAESSGNASRGEFIEEVPLKHEAQVNAAVLGQLASASTDLPLEISKAFDHHLASRSWNVS